MVTLYGYRSQEVCPSRGCLLPVPRLFRLVGQFRQPPNSNHAATMSASSHTVASFHPSPETPSAASAACQENAVRIWCDERVVMSHTAISTGSLLPRRVQLRQRHTVVGQWRTLDGNQTIGAGKRKQTPCSFSERKHRTEADTLLLLESRRRFASGGWSRRQEERVAIASNWRTRTRTRRGRRGVNCQLALSARRSIALFAVRNEFCRLSSDPSHAREDGLRQTAAGWRRRP